MNRKTLTLLVCLIAIAAIPALAGIVTLSVDIPAKAFDQASQGAALLVHVRYCDPEMPDSLTGVAEGIVNGKHQSLPLRLTPTSQDGVFAVKQQWPSQGAWVLTITATEHLTASAIVTLGKNGDVAGASVKNLLRKATAADLAEASKTAR